MNANAKAWAFIFARGGSKGLPGKNIKLLDGKPLIAHSIDAARRVPAIDRVVVSTDDPEIARIAEDWGAEAPFLRPAELARDDSPEWLAWRHALEWFRSRGEQPEVFVSLPTTSPLRSVSDVERCLQALDDQTDVVITVTEAHRSPWFNMVRQDSRGYCELLIQGRDVMRRQDAPQAFDMTTVAYVSRPQFILSQDGIFSGRVKAVVIPPERAADIDTPLDFAWVQFLMQNREADEC